MLFLSAISFLSCDDYLDLDRFGGWYPSTNGEITKTPDREESYSIETFIVNGVSFNMIPVEHGTFIMGSESGLSDERPVHSVTISKDFYIGETEVTQALWKAVTGHSPTSEGKAWSSANGLGNDFPAYYISWNDCQEFIAKLNELTEQKFRMPTEAEWEFAARGGKKSEGYIYSGSNNLDAVGWYDDNDAIFGPAFPDYGLHTVKSKLPNELGIYDMSGNVWEWCSDWYGTYSSSSVTDPAGPATGSYRVIRGGSWFYGATHCRSANRDDYTPTIRDNDLGFRLALSLSK